MLKIPFLSTKLSIPPLNRRHALRPRLIEKLDQSILEGRQLTLVSGPAGYGKTTLLSEWLHCSRYFTSGGYLPVWISLEDEDNNIKRFTALLTAALLRAIKGEMKEGWREIEEAHALENLKEVLSEVLDQVGSYNLVLVIDDYQWITDGSIEELMSSFFKALPQNMIVILSSRVKPSKRLYRYQLEWRLGEISQEDLKFRDEEVRKYFRKTLKITDEPGQTSKLVEKTEGWPVALQLITYQIERGKSLDEVINGLQSEGGPLLEYLMEEVYGRQREEVRAFLRQTSILKRLGTSLCNAVRGKKDSQEILRELERSNVFVMALDEGHEWYRYHVLFEEFLCERLRIEEGNERVKDLHLHASAWYEKEGREEEAVRHAFEAGDIERVAGLLEFWSLEKLTRVQLIAASKWLAAIPEKRLSRSPRLASFSAWLILIGVHENIKSLEKWVLVLEENLKAIFENEEVDIVFNHPAGELTAELAILKCYVRLINKQPVGLEEIKQMEEKISFCYPAQAMMAKVLLGDYYDNLGDRISFVQVMREGIFLSQVSHNYFLNSVFADNLLLEYTYNGQYSEAEKLLKNKDAILTGLEVLPYLRLYIPMTTGIIALERNRLNEAQEAVQKITETLRKEDLDRAVLLHLFLAEYYMVIQEPERAFHHIQEAGRPVHGEVLPPRKQAVNYYLAVFYFSQGQTENAIQWAKTLSFEPFQPHDIFKMSFYLLYCRVHLFLYRRGDPTARLDFCMDLLNRCLAGIQADATPYPVARANLLKGLIFQSLGQEEEALTATAHAIRLAEKEGYVRMFLEEGLEAARLIWLVRKNRNKSVYCYTLLKAFQKELGDLPFHWIGADEVAEENDYVATLSDREHDVLVCLAEGESNQEIAARLYISIDTVKKHVSQLLKKIGVNSRRQAVRRARELKWID